MSTVVTVPSSSSVLGTTTPEVTSTVTESVNKPLWVDGMKQLSIYQYNEICCSSSHVEWDKSKIPNEAVEIPYHLDHINIGVSYVRKSEIDEALVKPAVQVHGDVKWELKANPDYAEGFNIHITDPKGSFSVQVKGLPEMKFAPKDPLKYEIVKEKENEFANLTINGAEYGNQILIPAEQDTIILAFSEEMNTNSMPTLNSGKPAVGKWLDNKHLQITVSNMDNVDVDDQGIKQMTLDLNPLRVKTTSYLQLDNTSLTVKQYPAIQWRDGKSGKSIGFSPRDRYYKQIVTSPDGQSYIGVYPIGGALGDGDGYFYSYVLERANQEPVVIESHFYTTIEPFDTPVQWMDNNRILYSSYYGVYIYDIATGTKKLLRDNKPDEMYNINYAVYDQARKQIHVLVYNDRNESTGLDLFTYEDGKNELKVTRNYTSTVNLYMYTHLDMLIYPTSKGTYRTTIEQGIPYTTFVSNEGKTQKAVGYIRAVGEDGAYLERFEKGTTLKSIGFSYWQLGKTPQNFTTIPFADAIFGSGSKLIIQEDGKYLTYNPNSRKWEPWISVGKELGAVPVKGASGNYKVKNELAFGGLRIGSTIEEIKKVYGDNYHNNNGVSFEMANNKLVKAIWNPSYLDSTLVQKLQIPINKSEIDLSLKNEVKEVSCYHTATCKNYMFTNKDQQLLFQTDWGDKLVDFITLEGK
ncbi:hypothetical protein NV379_16660 [Paenibacillus sp. N1-5-1-14]|uniref:hypothetical protein n=1 Tax=Paenibacillus radicibacter TaxID=2972488 RepID=UPI0021595CA9|nr:hypothetical protein [Paenibacillus radicibacter]MCR8644286.1 hypothetical protein [Paenibacillus radicibacter]